MAALGLARHRLAIVGQRGDFFLGGCSCNYGRWRTCISVIIWISVELGSHFGPPKDLECWQQHACKKLAFNSQTLWERKVRADQLDSNAHLRCAREAWFGCISLYVLYYMEIYVYIYIWYIYIHTCLYTPIYTSALFIQLTFNIIWFNYISSKINLQECDIHPMISNAAKSGA